MICPFGQMIELTKVSKVFRTKHGEVRALDDVSLVIDAGEFVALRGHSGCGKSTLLSLVGGLALPSSGTIQVDGHCVSQMNSSERAEFRTNTIGFVFQMFHLLPYLNVFENVLAASATPGAGQTRSTAEELLSKFGLSDRLLHRPGQLSAGERQRVAMARALLNQPKLLLADEPTGNLDPKNASALLGLLSHFRDEGGTILLVTHDRDSANHADRIIEIDHGKIAATAGA